MERGAWNAGDGEDRHAGQPPRAVAGPRGRRPGSLAAHGWPESAIEIVVIRTSGDMIQDRALSQAGGKGLFTKEIDAALLEGGVDLAVHSAKDMPTRFPDGIVIAGYLAREDVRDALISAQGARASPICRRAPTSARPACAGRP